jgi:hypothetical protein
MSLEQLKLLAVERGVKREGVGWAACCPPAGSKADIVRALLASQYGVSDDSQYDPQVLYMSQYMCPHTTVCVRILLYVCPHTTIYVSSCYYVCPHATLCALILLHVSSYPYICVLILLNMCPHTTDYICNGFSHES